MTWALLVVAMWLALAGIAALVIGRSICMADEQDVAETDEQPNRVVDDVHGAARAVPPPASRTADAQPREASAPSGPPPGGPSTAGADGAPSRPRTSTDPTLTRSG